MTLFDFLHETYTALLSNKVRTSLTVLGIIIGIASVISMIAVGAGAEQSIQDNIQSLGSNLITILPGVQGGPGSFVSGGRGTAKTLIDSDATAIKNEVSGISAVSPELLGRYQITSRGKNTNTSVVGVLSVYPKVRNISISDGFFISEQNQQSLSKVAVLGPTVKADLFPDTDAVGQIIRINGQQFKVIGVTAVKGGTGFANQDDMIFIPLASAQRFLAGSDYVTSISVQAKTSEVMTQVQTDITALLLKLHKKKANEADFNVINQNDIVATASSVTSTFTLLLSAVAAISLLVGGIGIMNMMLTAVTERTREIGLRKAIGASRHDISRQFLFEAITLTLFGGFLGIVLGLLLSFLLDYFNIITTSISGWSILLAFGVSTVIGLIFGYYPAQRAAKLNPIDALRYE